MSLKYGGVTVKGEHFINQDSFICEKKGDILVVVVADGLGSKKNSHIGSKEVCEVIFEQAQKNDNIDLDFVECIHKKWIENLEKNYDISECCTTCLFAILKEGEIAVGQLGDGIIYYIDDKKNHIFKDDKEDHFANQTNCLNKNTKSSEWEFLKIKTEGKVNIFLSTDGLCIGDESKEDIVSFWREFEEGYSDFNEGQMNEHIKEWLSNWCGQDDKTLAYILKW